MLEWFNSTIMQPLQCTQRRSKTRPPMEPSPGNEVFQYGSGMPGTPAVVVDALSTWGGIGQRPAAAIPAPESPMARRSIHELEALYDDGAVGAGDGADGQEP